MQVCVCMCTCALVCVYICTCDGQCEYVCVYMYVRMTQNVRTNFCLELACV